MLLPNAGKEWYNGVEVITLLKVFLVEDECVVREGLRDCIDWERYGFEFCGDAPDGELALPQIRKLRPDILITDIKMPFMDGLALSKLVCAELPETRIILISGHNDFEFAQEAIEIGVEQYLLKPVTKASLLKTLEDVSRKIDEEREQKDYLRRFQQEGPEYEQFARRKFFEQITSGTLRVSEIYEQAKKLQIDIDAEGYTVILLTLQSRGTAEYSQTLAERLEELMAYLLRYGEYLLFRCNLMTYCVIVKGSAAGLDEAVRRCLENIERRCGGDEALAWYAAVSEPVPRHYPQFPADRYARGDPGFCIGISCVLRKRTGFDALPAVCAAGAALQRHPRGQELRLFAGGIPAPAYLRAGAAGGRRTRDAGKKLRRASAPRH